jgi:hypothetical protein
LTIPGDCRKIYPGLIAIAKTFKRRAIPAVCLTNPTERIAP